MSDDFKYEAIAASLSGYKAKPFPWRDIAKAAVKPKKRQTMADRIREVDERVHGKNWSL